MTINILAAIPLPTILNSLKFSYITACFDSLPLLYSEKLNFLHPVLFSENLGLVHS